METDVRPVDANALMARFFRKERLVQGAASAAYISARVNVRCVYYMKTARRVDLANLIEATTDILVKANVLEDDNSKIVAAHDGSRVEHDKKNPRVEIWIEEMKG